MKILLSPTALNNSTALYKKQQQNKSFGQSGFYLQDVNGIRTYSDCFVKNSFENEKDKTAGDLAARVVKNIENEWIGKANRVERYRSDLNKAEILNKMAHSLYDAGETEKAAVILATSFSIVPKKTYFKLDQDRTRKLVYDPENLSILKDFYKISQNKKARLFVMDSLKNLNSPYYLPVAEDILEFDRDTALYSDRQTSLSARQFLHAHYNFKLLKNILSKNELYKNAALTVFDKWGLPGDVPALEKLKQDSDIQIRAKAKNVEGHLKKLSVAEELTNSRDNSVQQPAESSKNLPSFETVVKELVNNPDSGIFTDLKKQKYPDGVFNASKLIEKAPYIKDSSAYSEVIKFVGQTGAFLEHLDFVKPDESNATDFDNEKAEAYCKILLRSNAKSPSFKRSPSFKGEYIILDKNKFDPLNATDRELDDLAEIFNEQSDYSIKLALNARYGEEGFFEAIFSPGSYDKRLKTAFNRLSTKIEKVNQKKQKLLKESNDLTQKAALGTSNVTQQKVRLNKALLKPLELNKTNENMPVPSGVFIYGKAYDSDKNKFVDWLKNEADAEFVQTSYDPANPEASIADIARKLNAAEQYYQMTRNRTILYTEGIDKLLTDTGSDISNNYIDDFKRFVENAGKSHTTFLIKTNLPRDDFDSAVIAPHRFGVQLNLSEGITEEDQKRLDEVNKELDRLHKKASGASELVKYDPTDYSGFSDASAKYYQDEITYGTIY